MKSSLLEKVFVSLRHIKPLKSKKLMRSLCLLSLLFLFGYTGYNLHNTFAASSPWTQTDWTGGSAGGTVTGTVTTYETLSNIDPTTTSGQFALSPEAEKFSNTTLDSESELNSWLGKTPSNVSNLQFWTVAGTEAYTDAGSTLATDSQTVQQWNNQSSSGKDASQATGSSRPTYRTNSINGRPSIDFDGNDSMTTSNVINGTGARSVLIVASPDQFVGTYGGGLLDLATSGSTGGYYAVTIELRLESVEIGSTMKHSPWGQQVCLLLKAAHQNHQAI